ncbi:MAG: DUF397 domain-containing protein [Streptosporangiaceae bacterium]|nr:DUF397 domain-containing protein [Streptosporangiaceae bacterium]
MWRKSTRSDSNGGQCVRGDIARGSAL